MNSKITKERITAVLFLIALLFGVFLWVYGCLTSKDLSIFAPAAKITSLDEVGSATETILNDAMDSSHNFVQLYGGIQKWLGRRMVQDADSTYTVYKLSDGTITFINPNAATNLSEHAEAYLAFKDVLAQKEIPLLHVQAPQKIGKEGTPELPAGVVDYGNQNADGFIELISSEGAPVLDFRDVLRQDGQHWTSYFYTTDHHWKPETALLCTQELVSYLNENYGFEMDPVLTDTSSFSTQVYEDIFLGSQGKRTGSLYAGVDDFTVLAPSYDTCFTYSVPSRKMERTGTFEDSLLFQERLEAGDLFETNPYTFYSGGDYALAQMINHSNEDGPNIVLLRDSYSCTLAPFLALQCSQLTTIDPRYFSGDLMATITELEPDIVISLYTPGAVANDTFFEFG